MQASDTAIRLFAVQQLNDIVITELVTRLYGSDWINFNDVLFYRVTNKIQYTVDIQNTNDAQIIRGGFFSADWS